MAEIKIKGDFKKTDRFLRRNIKMSYLQVLEHYGQKGVEALQMATPLRTGETAASWYYEIAANKDGAEIRWCNSNAKEGWANIAILLQTGHATRNGGYVVGIDYINPALRPIFEDIANKAFREVTRQ